MSWYHPSLSPMQRTIIRRMRKGDYVWCLDCKAWIEGDNGATRNISEKEFMGLISEVLIDEGKRTGRYELTSRGLHINVSIHSRSKKIEADFWNKL